MCPKIEALVKRFIRVLPRQEVVIGDAYLEKGKNDTRRTFLCLIGEKGKVLLTFFTDK